MNTHIEKAMELRSETPMVNNCTQAIMRVYADELGIDYSTPWTYEDLDANLRKIGRASCRERV